MPVLSSTAEGSRRAGFGDREGPRGDPARSLVRRLHAALRVSSLEITRGGGACREAAWARTMSASARERRRVHTRPTHTASVRPSGPLGDPLAATITVARACDDLAVVEFFGAGLRFGSLQPQLFAEADLGQVFDHGPRQDRRRSMPGGGRSEDGLRAGAGFPPHDAPNSPVRLRIYATERGGRRVIRLVGELDVVDADRVQDLLAEHGGHTVVLDLTDLHFIDAAGIAAVLAATQQARASGRELVVRGAGGIVRRVFEITGLGCLLSP